NVAHLDVRQELHSNTILSEVFPDLSSLRRPGGLRNNWSHRVASVSKCRPSLDCPLPWVRCECARSSRGARSHVSVTLPRGCGNHRRVAHHGTTADRPWSPG